MEKHAQKLLDKQLRGIIPARHDGVMILAIVTVFFVGIALGGALFARKSEAQQIASYSLLNAAADNAGMNNPKVRAAWRTLVSPL
jgi:ferritin-like metal-binding protein YciE